MCALDGLCYEKSPLKFLQMTQEKTSSVTTVQKVKSCSMSESLMDRDVTQEIRVTKQQTHLKQQIPLCSKEGTIRFLKGLLLLKSAFLSKHNHMSAFTRLQAFLRDGDDNSESNASIDELKGKRKYVMNNYKAHLNDRRLPATFTEYIPVCSVIFGDKDDNILKGTPFELSEAEMLNMSSVRGLSHQSQVSKFTKGTELCPGFILSFFQSPILIMNLQFSL